jgi:co-chaperonin GroES (HSP10)
VIAGLGAGDRVLLPMYVGTELEDDLVIVKEGDVLAVDEGGK